MDDREAVLYTGQTFTGRSGHDYVLGSKIGDGGFAGIFLAVEQGTGREVAVKVLAISNRRAEAVGEFQDEAALLGVLTSCSNVVTLIDHGEHVMHLQAQGGGPVLPVPVPFMVLERAVGSLEELLANRHQIEWIDRLTLYREVAKGVHQMHLRRFVHRDVKSENGLVFEDDPKARISDLGRSKNTRDDTRFPPIAYEAGRGDIRFAPPELLWRLGDDSAATHFRIDLYLLGSLLYEVATATGITSAALGNPSAILNYAGTLGSGAARERDYRQQVPILRERFELVYEAFANELPRAVARDATVLLRQLTDPDPSRREPSRPFHGLPMQWDLQWLLVRVDILIRRLAADRRAADAAKRRYRRQKEGARK